MQNKQIDRKIAKFRRDYSLLLAILFIIITTPMVFAFGFQVFYMIAILASPLLIIIIWEEVLAQHLTPAPARNAHNH